MRILSLTIANFRSFGPEPQTLNFDYKLVCLIGLNSAGKTAALAALQKLFGSRSERMIYREDFHLAHDEEQAQEHPRSFWIEVVIGFEEEEPTIAAFFQDMVIQQPQEAPYLRIRLEASWSPSAASLEGEVETHQHFIKLPQGEEITVDAKREFPRYMYNLFQIIYVPALRKTADQLRYASGSILHRLLKTVEYNEVFKNNYQEVTNVLNTMFRELPSLQSIQLSLQGLWSQFHRDLRYRDAMMNFGSGELDDILRKLEINFTPGQGPHRKFGVNDLGDGYRSLFYLTLVCTLLEIEDSLPLDMEIEGNFRPLLTILAVEEPENHIAPQILGRVIKILEAVSARVNTQVILTSHTPAIVKRLHPEMILHFRISDRAITVVSSIELPSKEDDAYKYIKEALQNYPEIYFAKLVVIGEGDSEEVLFNHMMKVLNVDFDDNIVCFAPLGHRFVSHIWKMLFKLRIPHITLLDLDLERGGGGGWGRIKYALKELISNGVPRDEILRLQQGALTDKQLENMHNRDATLVTSMQRWIERLKTYGVYFSQPLDLDFLMLEAFETHYTAQGSYPPGGGPDIPDEIGDPGKYQAYLEAAVQATLKSKNAEGQLYTQHQRELMIWYKYHFLGRGKPVTHMRVLSEIPDDELRANLPPVIQEIFDQINASLT